MPKASTIGIYASVFALIVAIVAVGYRPPQEVAGVANTAPVVNDTTAEATSVDEVVATTVAANLAQSTNLSVAPNALEFAVSAQTRSQLLQTDDTTVISKPDIVELTGESRAVQKYITKQGDTVSSVAQRFGISTDTVKWANNLTSDGLEKGKTLTILPTDGVRYSVKSGDTLASISAKYDVDQTRVVLYNDLGERGIVAGQKLILPNANLPTTERPGYVAPVVYNPVNYAAGGWGGEVKFLYRNSASASPGNMNSWGYCTWYAWERRQALGRPLPAVALGNAADWAYSLRNLGYTVVYGEPKVGAIMQNGGGVGHVAIVESIAGNGDVVITEMNYAGWWNTVSQRTISAGQATNYNYIY